MPEHDYRTEDGRKMDRHGKVEEPVGLYSEKVP